jgi:hypothetical protein
MKLPIRSALLVAAAVFASQAQAQQIITAVNTDDNTANVHDDFASFTTGQYVGNVYQGTDVHAQTSYGVNKVYGSTTNGIELSATSAWLDQFTAGGSANDTVRLSFSFTVDGTAAFSNPATYLNFQVFALRGDGWTLNGDGGGSFASFYSPRTAGSDFDDLFFQRAVTGGSVIQLSARDSQSGVFNYANVNGSAGTFGSNVNYDATEDFYVIRTLNPNGQIIENKFYADRRVTSVAGGPPSTLLYSQAGNPAAAAAKATRLNLEANYSVLDIASLCDPAAGCGAGTYPPQTVTVAFDVRGGSTFAIGGIMLLDELDDGAIDFFNTARLTGVAAENLTTPGTSVSLYSEALKGELPASTGGQFVYPPSVPQTGAVPEPATWAMMIGGFGLIGSLARRRALRPAHA